MCATSTTQACAYTLHEWPTSRCPWHAGCVLLLFILVARGSWVSAVYKIPILSYIKVAVRNAASGPPGA
jgi:hypothetical protein